VKKLTIAIDGPAGAGKSTVARKVASELGYTYIDTGAMYRAAALKGMRLALSLEDADAYSKLAQSIIIVFEPDGAGGQRVMMDGEDVTLLIRSPEVTRLSSPVSAIPGVRRALVRLQQQMGMDGGVVMEGRDIGTVVFPDAHVKVFLNASEKERARRRLQELHARGENSSLEEVLASQKERDERDSSRKDSPLMAAQDAILIDTDHLNADDVVDQILKLCQKQML
jgi:cytidylate kinase